MTPPKTLRRALSCIALVLAACGVGTKEEPVYVEGIIGTGGGVLENDHVRCEVPPGAFTEETVCALVPFPDPLPIDPAEGGTIEFLPGCVCIGPRGKPLLVDGFLRICYLEGDVPPQSSEDDLVLLEWDEALGFMVVKPAFHDAAGNCFEDTAYDELGYVAVGVRTRPAPGFDFVFFGGAPPPAAILPQGGFPLNPVIVLADGDGELAAVPMLGTEDGNRYLPSFDGSRVMFLVPNFETEGTALSTVPTTPPFTPVEVLPEQTFRPVDNLLGWLGTQDRVYHEHGPAIAGQGTVPTPSSFFAYKAGDGTGSVVDLATASGFVFLDDVRVSPDRSKVLLKWVEFGNAITYRVDVIDAVTGAPIGTNLPTDTDSGERTPRWLPDSSGVYFVEDDGQTVTRVDPDGTDPQTIYDIVALGGFLIDFVVAPPFPPAPQRCAYVRRDTSTFLASFGQGGGPDYFETDALAGGDHSSLDLGDFVQVVDMAPLFSQGAFSTPLVVAQMRIEARFFEIAPQAVLPTDPEGHTFLFDLGKASLVADIPAPLSHVDVSRAPQSAGRILAWVQTTDKEAYPEYPSPGIYLFDESGLNPVDVTPAGAAVFAPPRWLRSWRLSPGFDSYFPQLR